MSPAADGAPRKTVHENFHGSLIHVHRDLQSRARGIAVASAETSAEEPDRLTAMIKQYGQELENHHRSEDVFFFPAFRAAGRLKSFDVAFLDARDDEHVTLVKLCAQLQHLTERQPDGASDRAPWLRSIHRTINEIADVADPHFGAEEDVLTGAHLQEMISARQLVDVYRDMGQNWNTR